MISKGSKRRNKLSNGLRLLKASTEMILFIFVLTICIKYLDEGQLRSLLNNYG
jgi:hypothetical protein